MKLAFQIACAFSFFVALPFVPYRVQAQETAASIQAKRPSRDLVLGPDDSLNIVALNCDELTKAWRIGTSGDLSLPLVGTIHTTGLTSNQLGEIISERLKKYLKDPQVTVYVTELRSQPVMITGAVDKPGVYQMGGSKALFEVILMAGGPRAAGPTVSVRRSSALGGINIQGVKEYQDDGYNFVELDTNEVMTGRGDKATLLVEPHDIITVSSARAQRFVHISGEVARPGAVELVTQDAVSLMRLVATAGGATAVANLGQTMIMHVNADGSQASAPMFVDLKKIMQGKAMDLSLTAGDVVVLGRSGLKSMLQTATTAAMNTGVSSSVLVLARI